MQGTGRRSAINATMAKVLEATTQRHRRAAAKGTSNAKGGGTRIELFSADQSDPAELARIAAHFGTARGGGARAGTGGFDAIVDDGSHTPRDQVSTLAMLFPLVRPGGAFIIEDIGSSWNHDYGHLTPARGAPRHEQRTGVLLERTALGLVRHWLASGTLPPPERLPSGTDAILSPERRAYLERCIGCMRFAAAQDGATCLVVKSAACEEEGTPLPAGYRR